MQKSKIPQARFKKEVRAIRVNRPNIEEDNVGAWLVGYVVHKA
jgi:hypothetical protein